MVGTCTVVKSKRQGIVLGYVHVCMNGRNSKDVLVSMCCLTCIV